MTTNELATKLAPVRWGLLCIWIGIAFWLQVTSAIGLLGLGIITLGAQVARKCLSLDVELFWLIAGLLFVAGGVWSLYGVELPFTPIVIVLGGVALLVTIVRPRR